MKISDVSQARAGIIAFTDKTCLKQTSATVDWFDNSTRAARRPTHARHNPRHPTIRNYSLGTQEAIDAERVELDWPPDESHHERLRLQV